MKLNEVKCKSILSESGIYGVDYSVNPYIGCEHGCRYCYATFMRRYTNHREAWGEFVDVKVNAGEVLEGDLMDRRKGSVLLSSVTDPYQPVEEKYEITRRILRRLADTKFPVTILTKSDLVLRDLDILEEFRPDRISVGFTLNFLDEEHRGIWEPGAPEISRRIAALKKVSEHEIDSYLHVGPYLPGITSLEDILDRVEEYVSELQVEDVNMGGGEGIMGTIRANYPDLTQTYESIGRDPSLYRRELGERVQRLKESSEVTISLFLE